MTSTVFRLIPILILCTLTVGLSSGCAARRVQAYPGPPRPSSEVSVLSVNKMRNHAKIGITAIDKTSAYNFLTSMVTNRTGAIAVTVLPGKHTVNAHIQMANLFTDGAVWWVAQAGHDYELQGSIIGYKAAIEIIDLRNGRRVGGIVGSLDEPYPRSD